MKNVSVAILLMTIFICCDSPKKGIENIGGEDGGRIISIDVDIDDEGSETEVNENYQYACAKAYIQIPYDTRNPDTGETSTIVSHQLLSVPVMKSILSEDNRWYAISTEFNVDMPEASNAGDEGEVYAILILEDETILYDQIILPTPELTWQVCELLYCGQEGCQNHEGFEHENWSCSITQNRSTQSDNLNKCPCMFNDAGYPFCDVRYDKETKE